MKNKFIAAIFAFIGGGIGLHKFYLGKWGQGIVYIILSITFIPLVISIFEGLLYLLNSQEWFDITFNAEFIKNQEELKRIRERNKTSIITK